MYSPPDELRTFSHKSPWPNTALPRPPIDPTITAYFSSPHDRYKTNPTIRSSNGISSPVTDFPPSPIPGNILRLLFQPRSSLPTYNNPHSRRHRSPSERVALETMPDSKENAFSRMAQAYHHGRLGPAGPCEGFLSPSLPVRLRHQHQRPSTLLVDDPLLGGGGRPLSSGCVYLGHAPPPNNHHCCSLKQRFQGS